MIHEVKGWQKDVYCREQYDIKEDYFNYDGLLWRVDYNGTYNVNLGQDFTGCPELSFIIASNTSDLCEHIRLKRFLIKDWCPLKKEDIVIKLQQ